MKLCIVKVTYKPAVTTLQHENFHKEHFPCVPFCSALAKNRVMNATGKEQCIIFISRCVHKQNSFHC